MNVTSKKLAVMTVAALMYSAGSAFAQATPPSPLALHPSALPARPAPPVPQNGPYQHAAHGKKVAAAVAKHAAIACDHLAHHFVGTYAHKAFLTECHHTHHNVLTHVMPHPDGAKS